MGKFVRLHPRRVDLGNGRFMILSGKLQKFPSKVKLPEHEPCQFTDKVLFPRPVGSIGFIPLYNLWADGTPMDQVPRAVVDAEDWRRVHRHSWTGVRRKLRSKTIIQVWTKLKDAGGPTMMGRFIMRVTDPNAVVRYLDGNTLNNRKSNLYVVP